MLGVQTIGNATLIAYDGIPVLSTDPWMGRDHYAYFGSWHLPYNIPGLEIFISVLIITFIGWISLSFIGRKLFDYFEAILNKIPILRTIKEGLATNKINKVYGILNGTTNYILSEMENSNIEFKIQGGAISNKNRKKVLLIGYNF